MSRGKRFTQQELDFMKVHALDMTISEIAVALGRNYWAVQRVMQNRRGEELSDEHKRKIDALKEEGNTVYQIAKKLNIGYYVVFGYLNKRINVKQNHMFSAKEDDVLRNLYGKYRVKYIATLIGVTEEQVYNRAKKLGIQKKIRSKNTI